MKKEDFNRLKEQLTHDRIGKGVDEHITADPIFLVQEKTRIYLVSPEAADATALVCVEEGDEWSDCMDFYEGLDEEEQAKLDALSFGYMLEEEKLEVLRNNLGYPSLHIVEYRNKWEYVSTHVTREAAKLYIKQMKHRHQGELQIYVDSAYRCWDFNDLLDGIINGKVVYKEDV